MDRLERFYKIDRLLKERRVVSFEAFRRELGMSPASVKRDLAYMRERFNAPIEYDREANGYRFGAPRAGPRYELPGLWFNAEEVHALLTTLELLRGLQPGLLDGQVEPVVDRLRGILGGGAHSATEVERRIRIFQPERRAAEATYFSLIAAALLKRTRVWIRHYNRAEDRETEREVSPQRLVHYRDNWYLDAWCHLRDDLRSFAVDAVRDARLRDARAKDVPDATLDRHLGAGYGIFPGATVAWARIRFSQRAARWVSPQRWHPDERRSMEKDGALVLEVPYADDRELVMEVLKFGADAEILAPAALRARVTEALRHAAEQYQNRGRSPN